MSVNSSLVTGLRVGALAIDNTWIIISGEFDIVVSELHNFDSFAVFKIEGVTMDNSFNINAVGEGGDAYTCYIRPDGIVYISIRSYIPSQDAIIRIAGIAVL